MTSSESELNSILFEVKDGDDNNFLTRTQEKEIFLNVENASTSIIYENPKIISLWNEYDIKCWVSLISNSNKNYTREELLAEMIAVVKRAIFLIFEIDLRKVQILSVIFFLTKPKNIGRLAEIKTGEGKSITVAVTAVIKVLQGENFIDVITSSEELAPRDAEKNRKFYELFQITVGENTDKICSPKECYKKNIVYGTVHSFQADILFDEYENYGTLNGRYAERQKGKVGFAIVDEVDCMLIDEHNKFTHLSKSVPDFAILSFLLTMIWQALGKLVLDESNMILNLSHTKAEKNAETYLVNVGNRLLDTYILKNIPKRIREYAIKTLPTWAKNAIRVKCNEFEEDCQFMIEDGNAKPIDAENTGSIQENSHFSHGIHQFIQLKHNLKLTPLGLTTTYMSNVCFFNRYINENENNILGLTGTLGSKKSCELLKDIYRVDFIFMPQNVKSNLNIYTNNPNFEDKESWKAEIVKCTRAEIEREHPRAVLIICQTIWAAKDIMKEFNKSNEVILYISNSKTNSSMTKTTAIPKFDEKTPVSCGQIIIATNLAGRGTDIKLTKELNDNGGLHVIVSFLPENERVQNQAFGRAGRQGNNGSAQLILNSKYSFSQLTYMRSIMEDKILKNAKQSIHQVNLEDKIFVEIKRTVNENDEIKNNPERRNAYEEMWGIWRETLDKTNSEEEIFESFNSFQSEALHGIINFNSLNEECLKNLKDDVKPYYKIIEKCDESIKFNPNSFIPYLNKAVALLKTAFTSTYLNNSIQCYEDSRKYLNEKIKKSIIKHFIYISNNIKVDPFELFQIEIDSKIEREIIPFNIDSIKQFREMSFLKR